MRVLFAGTPPNAAQTLEALISAGIDVVGVLTRLDAPIGRKKVITPSPVAQVAEAHGLPIFKHNRVDEIALQQIASLHADLGLVVAFGNLLRKEALDALPLGWINLHYSLLPKYRGAAPVQAAIRDGSSETGISIFQLDEGMDSGDLILQVPTEIQPGESAGRLLERLTSLGVSALLEALPGVAAGIIHRTKQDASLASYAGKITRDDAKIDWSKSSGQIENLINAMNPEPVAWTTYQAQAFRIHEARTTIRENSLAQLENLPGSVHEVDSRILVSCGHDESLELISVQPFGKSIMSAQDWYRGQQSKVRVTFE